MPIISKSNHSHAVRRRTTENTSNVSTFVSQKKQTYVRRYVMTQGQKRVWLENHMPEDASAVLMPSPKQIRAIKRNDKPRDKKRAIITFAVIFSVIVVSILALPIIQFISSKLIIQEIQINGDSPYSADEIFEASGLQLNMHLPFFSTSDAENKVLSALPYIKECSITVALPNVVTFEISEEQAVAYANVAGDYYAFNDSLRVLERSEDSRRFDGLLYIEIPNSTKVVVGEKVELADSVSPDFICDFISDLQESELNERVDEVNFTNKYDITLSVDGHYNILIGTPDKISVKLATASGIIEKTAERYKEYNTVDVRILKLAGIRPN